MQKKVFVSGCFDMLHSGHIAFLQKAATYGDLYVALGSDQTVYDLKGRLPVTNEQERLYMLQSLTCVKQAFISSGNGMIDFEAEFRAIGPDLFIVNQDGNIPQKEALCRQNGVEYVVLQREPHENLPVRSTTALRRVEQMPYRIDLAGGWLDQPFVSALYPGPVLTFSIEPTITFNERSGMATSTRNSALDLWGVRLPPGDPEKLAKILFCYDNPPGTTQISGSQDAIGIVIPGVTRSYYTGQYWPAAIETVGDELTLQFIEESICLLPLDPRVSQYDPLAETRITMEGAKALADAAENCWRAILAHDVNAFGLFARQSFEAQISMFPHMMNSAIQQLIDRNCENALGWKLSGAGGGGYLILISDRSIENGIRINIRRRQSE